MLRNPNLSISGRLLVVGAVAILLAGCGGSSKTASKAAGSTPAGTGVAAVDTTQPSPSETASSTPSGDASAVDVCALLSQDDAAAVARAKGLNGAQTAATKYKLTAKKLPVQNKTASCEFSIDGEGASGTVVIQVMSAENFSLYANGKKVDGLGDEAYTDGSATVVRVGGLMMTTSEDSFTNSFVTELFRKMAPHLKQ